MKNKIRLYVILSLVLMVGGWIGAGVGIFSRGENSATIFCISLVPIIIGLYFQRKWIDMKGKYKEENQNGAK